MLSWAKNQPYIISVEARMSKNFTLQDYRQMGEYFLFWITMIIGGGEYLQLGKFQ